MIVGLCPYFFFAVEKGIVVFRAFELCRFESGSEFDSFYCGYTEKYRREERFETIVHSAAYTGREVLWRSLLLFRRESLHPFLPE